MPHPWARAAGRDTLTSRTGPSRNASTSLARATGSMRKRPSRIAEAIASACRDSRKNQLSSSMRSVGVACSAHQSPSTNASQPLQYEPVYDPR
jgi:hypothetical protein